MLIKQNQLLGEATALLDSLDRFSLDESVISPLCVNVRHNPRLNQDLVQLESFLDYAQANGIDDAGLALHRVCEANEVPRNSLAFLANEENLLADDELLETFSQLQGAGFPMHIARISDVSPYYTQLLEALSLDQAYDTLEESPNLIRYINESVVDDAKTKITNAASSAKSKAASGAKDAAAKLASVRKEIAKKSSEMLKATGPAKVFLKRQIDKLKDTASALKRKLVSAKDTVGDKLSSVGSSIKGAASSVGSKLSGAVDSVKSGLGSVKNKITGGADSAKNALSNVGKNISNAADLAKGSVSSGIDKVRSKFA